jgi:hypothetical protein
MAWISAAKAEGSVQHLVTGRFIDGDHYGGADAQLALVRPGSVELHIVRADGTTSCAFSQPWTKPVVAASVMPQPASSGRADLFVLLGEAGRLVVLTYGPAVGRLVVVQELQLCPPGKASVAPAHHPAVRTACVPSLG